MISSWTVHELFMNVYLCELFRNYWWILFMNYFFHNKFLNSSWTVMVNCSWTLVHEPTMRVFYELFMNCSWTFMNVHEQFIKSWTTFHRGRYIYLKMLCVFFVKFYPPNMWSTSILSGNIIVSEAECLIFNFTMYLWNGLCVIIWFDLPVYYTWTMVWSSSSSRNHDNDEVFHDNNGPWPSVTANDQQSSTDISHQTIGSHDKLQYWS